MNKLEGQTPVKPEDTVTASGQQPVSESVCNQVPTPSEDNTKTPQTPRGFIWPYYRQLGMRKKL